MRRLPPSLLLLLLIGLMPLPARADVPEFHEELVYRMSLFDGRGYTQAFVPRSEETIYMMAGKNNALSPRATLVYFWPITGKYVAAFKKLNEEIEGSLEILREGRVIQSHQKQDYMLFYPEGFMKGIAEMHVGRDAYATFKKYEKPLTDYYTRMDEFQRANQEYRKRILAYVKDLERSKKAGEKLDPDEIRAEMPRKPTPPQRPKFDVTSLRRDFVLNLPEGLYKIRMRARDGTIIEDSEKRLVVFTRRRAGGVGYEIIRANKWTKPENSNDPAETLYAAGENTLYVRPFHEDEYNELFYRKLQDPQNKGNPDRWIWVHISPIQEVRLALLAGSRVVAKEERKPYLVRNIPGPELGYRILDYEAQDFPDTTPTFEAHKIVFPPPSGKGKYTFRLENKEGQPLEKSTRNIIALKKERADILYLISIFPLLIGFGVFVRRKTTTS
ncbi:MAG: hypothetical protein JRH07_08425 [Deltaproteobacteria bacterium]|nr:hypothetical protein [Deltaproteobacteria bacterium]